MKIICEIEVHPDGGVTCNADVFNETEMTDSMANILTVCALEVARSSPLARLWGVNISPFKEEK